ncbi:MAG: methyltransferase domain-containing protein [Rudaea sp.]|nr:methyltransferase domain-containing protein [Rudaea sp.]
MIDEKPAVADPHWGQLGREEKAECILRTVENFIGRDVSQGVWLDVGCGSGGVAATLAQHVKQVIGVDPESWQRWQQMCDKSPNLSFHAGSYRELEKVLAAESADVVVCNQVYEHVDDPQALLSAIHRVMKPGGLCYFAGPNLLWPIEPHVFWPFVHWLPRLFAQRAMTALGSKQAHCLDAWSWSYSRLTKAFVRAGFVASGAISERIRAQAQVSPSTFSRMAAHLPRSVVSVLTPVAPGFVFILTKPEAIAASP